MSLNPNTLNPLNPLNPMPQELFHVVDMERRLRADRSGTVRDEILTNLRANKAQLKSTLATGLAITDFEALTKLNRAVEQAEIVIESYWLANHQN